MAQKKHYSACLTGLCLIFLNIGFSPTFASASGDILTQSLNLNFASSTVKIPKELSLTTANQVLMQAVRIDEEGKPAYKELYDFCQFIRSIFCKMSSTEKTQEMYRSAETELLKSVTTSLWTDLGEDQNRTKRKRSSLEEFDQDLCDAYFQKYLQPSYLRGVDYLLFGSDTILKLHYPKSTSPDIKVTYSCSVVFSNFVTSPLPSLFSTFSTTTARPYLTSYSLLGGALEKLIYATKEGTVNEKPMADVLFTTVFLFAKMWRQPIFQDLPARWTESITYGGKLASKDVSSLLATLTYAMILEAKAGKLSHGKTF